jgi:hypothetical protein
MVQEPSAWSLLDFKGWPGSDVLRRETALHDESARHVPVERSDVALAFSFLRSEDKGRESLL